MVYTVDESRKMNGTDMRSLWWIDTEIRMGDMIKILDDSFTVVGKGIQKLEITWISGHVGFFLGIMSCHTTTRSMDYSLISS